MPIAPLMKRFVSDELARSPELVAHVISGTVQALRDARVSGSAGADRAQQVQLIEALQRHAAAYEKRFVDTLRDKVIEALKEQQDGGLAAVAAGGGLQLMDESLIEVDIEISRAMQLIDTTAEWELRELQTFTSTLSGQTHVSAESNPMRPLMYATALWQAGCMVVPEQATRATLLRVSAAVLAARLKLSWAAACTRLESQGVEPGVYRTVLLPAGMSMGRAAAEPGAPPGALGGLMRRMPVDANEHAAAGPTAGGRGAVAGGTGGTGGADALSGRAIPGAPATTSNTRASGPSAAGVPAGITVALEAALRRMELMLSQPPVAPAPGVPAPPPARRLGDHRAALLASADQLVDRQTIELLVRLFEVILSDTGLPAPFRSVISRLQAPALRVALSDRSMMSSHQHPAWQLVDRIGDASGAHAHGGDPRLLALLAACRGIVEEIAKTPAPDTALMRRGVARIDEFMAAQFQAQLAAAQPSIDAMERAERRDALEQHLADRLAEQMAPLRTPPSVRRFVGTTWNRVMAEAMLRFGEDQEPTLGYIKAVDELLWSVQLPDHPQSRQRLLALLPGLLQRLRAGMALIALPAAEQSALLDELMVLHAEALRPGARGGPGALSSAEIVQRMRDEVLPETRATNGADSVIDLASMETVPAELMLNEPPADDVPGKTIDALQPAFWYRLFVQGRWQRVQLLWHGPRRRMFVFAGDNPSRFHSVTRRALERLAEAGLLQPIPAASLTQRAVEVLGKQLSASSAG